MRTRSLLLRALVFGGLVCLLTLPAMAQNPTGTVTGRATHNGEALPGVTVRATSPALPGGAQVAVTGASGDYILQFLPPGTYNVTFTLDGFATLETEVKVSIAQDRVLDAEMQEAKTAEEIVVTGAYETVPTTSQASVTFQQSTIDELPVDRDMHTIATLAPGVANNASSAGGVNIAGAPGPQTLWLVNGVVVNDTIWGSAFGLYVEDAVEETTVSVSGVSAEYGRFTGGVVNMVTKSGGNQFSGSYRLRLTNDSWNGETPLTTSQTDKINKRHEGTLGGYLMKDHLWFFLAGRNYKTEQQGQYANEVPYPQSDEETRLEGKLTVAPTISHRLLGSYMTVDRKQDGNARILPLEPTAVINRELPQEMFALNYTGVISENFFVEGQYSKRKFTFKHSGGTAAPGDRINGTGIYFYYSGWAGSHLFCSSCPGGDERRDNEDALAKGSLFFSSTSMGSHDLVFGYDGFTDILESNNYQSPSNFVMYDYHPAEATNPVTGGQMSMWGDDGVFYPAIYGYTELDFWPILAISRGTDFQMDSAFANDTWRLNNHWTFNVGVRYDKNHAVDGGGNLVSDSSQLSPRLGISYDVKGDGDLIINASYGRYVALLDSGEGGEAGGGSPSWIGNMYLGPEINVDENGVYQHQYTTPEALAIVFDWFDSIGGIENTDNWYSSPSLAGYNLQIPTLDSPYADEYSIGFVKRLGSKGLVRADYVHRTWGDFYMNHTDLNTGQIAASVPVTSEVTLNQDFDLTIRSNDNSVLHRDYHGIHTMFQYRFSDRLMAGVNYTWSHLYGNFSGENTSNGITVSSAGDYPEYRQASWNYPNGDLPQDQRHNIAAYAVWDVLSTPRHNLTLSWLESYTTGTPYSASGDARVSYYVTNPGYLTPPLYETYYFQGYGNYRTDDVHSSDLSVNYSFFLNLFGSQVQLYIEPEVQNLFNEHAVVNPNTTIYTWRNSATMELFDPFTETPVEGVNWEKGEEFGQADSEGDFQTARVVRLNIGFRF